jgi:hypothetical protein
MKFTVRELQEKVYRVDLTYADIIGMVAHLLTTTGNKDAIEGEVCLHSPDVVEVRSISRDPKEIGGKGEIRIGRFIEHHERIRLEWKAIHTIKDKEADI